MKRLVPTLFLKWLFLGKNRRLVGPSRNFLENNIFTYLNSLSESGDKLLFIGVASYTSDYYSSLNYETFTIDLQQTRAKYGEKGRHVVGDALNLQKYYPREVFSVVIANGLIGYGLEGENEVRRLLDSVFQSLKPLGVFVLGFNNTADHIDFDLLDPQLWGQFKPLIPKVKGMSHCHKLVNSENGHTFLFLQKNEE